MHELMKKTVFCIVAALTLMVTAFAQTPEEIIKKMDQAFAPAETEGLAMTLDLKIPIVGTSTTYMYTIGKKERSETTIMKHKIITFMDEDTIWEYNTVSNELKIKDALHIESAGGSEADLFSGILEGYDVTLKEETDDEWHLLCKKSKNNTEKEDPSKMDLVVSKTTNLPVSLTTKVSGVTIVMHDIKIGIDEKYVTFDPADYPDAKIVDERKK